MKAEAETRFKAISEAYQTMLRPRRRRSPGGRKQLALVAPDVWRAKHEEIVSAARYARSALPLGASPPRRVTSDCRIECPHCSRRFGRVQAERHIAKCASIVNKPKSPLRRSQAPGGHLPARSPSSRPHTKPEFLIGKTSFEELREGMAVSIEGLSNATHLNGTTGTLQMFDQQTGRWHVDLVDDGAEISVRVENLRRLAPQPPSLSPGRSSLHKAAPARWAAGQADRLSSPQSPAP